MAIKISDRLKKIADQVDYGASIADIGTDHGLLPIFLLEEKKLRHAVLCDINAGPLKKAERNTARHSPGAPVDFRLGSGLAVLADYEVDTVIIAGMGGRTIIGILDDDIPHARTFGKYLFQPRRDAALLRKWLLQNGFAIIDEALVRESRFICEIIAAVPNTSVATLEAYENTDFEFSPLLIERCDMLLPEFVHTKLSTEKKALSAIEAASTDNRLSPASAQRKEAILRRIRMMTDILERIGQISQEKQNDKEAR